MRLDVDIAFDTMTGMYRVSCVIQNSASEVMVVGAFPISCMTSSSMVELIAIQLGLQMASFHNLRILMVFSDVKF